MIKDNDKHKDNDKDMETKDRFYTYYILTIKRARSRRFRDVIDILLSNCVLQCIYRQ